MVSRCHVCERFRELDEREYQVALRNHLYFPACFRCWFMWPDQHKLWPAYGYGREAPPLTSVTAGHIAGGSA